MYIQRWKTDTVHGFYFFSSSFGGSGLGEASLNLHTVSLKCFMSKKNTYRLRLLIPTRTNRLPGRSTTFEVPESLGKLEGLNDNSLLLLVVPKLSVSGQGEVLAQRVAIETIIRHDAAQIRVSGEEDTEHVVNLTLVPQGSFVQTSETGHRAGLIGVGLYADTRVVSDAKKVVNDLEALVSGWIIDRGDIRDRRKFGRGVVFEEAHRWDDAGGRNVDAQLVLPDSELLDIFGQAGHDVLAVLVQTLSHMLVLVGWVDDRSAKRARGYK